MQTDPQPIDQSSSTNLPASLPPTTLLLQRTQTTLALLGDVVQESSGEYWYKKGLKAVEAEEWDEAIYDFERCKFIDKYSLNPIQALADTHRSRSEKRLREGDIAGSGLDEKISKELDDYLDYLIGMIDSMSQYSD